MELTPTRIRCGSIIPGNNPRTYFDPVEDAELHDLIKEHGVIQSVLLRQLDDNVYQLIAGERRWRQASKAHGADYEIPALVGTAEDTEALCLALIENHNRSNPSPTEEAKAAADLLALCAGDRQEVCRRLKWSPSTLASRLALMNCSDQVQKALNERRISLGHAELLAAAAKAKQDEVLVKLLAMPELPKVNDLKQMLQGVARPLASACFDQADCAACPHNSDLQTAMFSEAIAAGHCTNGTCYAAKTEAEIVKRAGALEGNFPRVQIVRPGENMIVLKLVADGPKGVGEEQAQACKACKNYGAAVSAVPGKEGNVYDGMCFDPSCNSRMVAKQIKAAREAKKQTDSGDADGASKKDAKPAAKTTKASTKVMVTAAVEQFRKRLWRLALGTDVTASPRASIQMLLAIALSNNARHIDHAKLQSAAAPLIPAVHGHDSIKASLNSLTGNPDDAVKSVVFHVAASALDGMGDHAVCEALEFFQIDLRKHFRLDSAFLDLLTKSEIESVAREVGLDKSFGDKFSKLFAKKKDELIKALLGVEGFDYAVVPKILKPAN
jgi:ParB family chromosome partitioning protein